jgi:peptidoglycan/LPS O-acetylase OafA/YrhL
MGLLRFFLALVVANVHFEAIVTKPDGTAGIPSLALLGMNSVYAVFFFYAISGFLITYTLTRNYERNLAGTLTFYRNRFIRIFSLYWPMAALALAFFPGAWADFLAGTPLDRFTNLFLIGADWNLAFARYPTDNWNGLIGGLHPAWTLGAELMFYALAPLLVRSWRMVAVLLVASLMVRAGAVHLTGPRLNETWAYYFAPSTFVFFMAGQGVCLAANRWAWLRRPALGYAALAAALAVLLLRQDKGLTDVTRLWVSAPFFALALPGFFAATKRNRVLNYFGDLSYPIYLTHVLTVAFVMIPLWPVFTAAVPNHQHLIIPVLIGFSLIAVIVAVAAHHLLEVPAARLMQQALRSRDYAPAGSLRGAAST